MKPSRTSLPSLLALAAAFAAGACGSSEHPSAPPAPPAEPAPTAAPAPAPADESVSGLVGEELVKSRATVTAIDPATRRVTVRRADGATATFRVGDNVRNLAQVKAGDEVEVSYYESLAYEVKKPGEAQPGAAVVAGAARAKEGEAPAGFAGRVMQVTATIVAIDRENMRVTLRGPDGGLVVYRAKDPEKLARVAVDDLVEITYTEALAVSVETPAAK